MTPQKNPFPYAQDNKRYHTFSYALKQRFGRKVCKVSLNAGLSCPNIDGTRGRGGCTYCSSAGSGEFGGDPALPLELQFEQVRRMLSKKWPDCAYLPYFQAHTNTYAPLPRLQELYERALALPGAVGLSISTRPDCIDEEIADYLGALCRRTYLTVELGLQTIHDDTARRINRCHTYAEFLEGFRLLEERGVPVVVHLIDGLPGENRDRMLETARAMAELPLYGVKLHLLHVLRGTPLAREYEAGGFRLLERDEYVDIVCSQLELFPATFVMGRLTGDGAPDDLIGPLWSRKKLVVLNEIDKELVRRDSFQGKYAPIKAGAFNTNSIDGELIYK
ncbi:TIGR01212 family radical SAM protein [Zongyangia hominis]|uniref:TIGR01212 family radical SAM protein n=1 Tax=Zongyangia hominis TaxID=2763677 RepID=A0A926IBR4_9FIRM|nr:TIGR01212 family radical SAM protein [Zongyangia hominis]MBC8570360.1 TIGR01212 family radical SAM protein [Zongyangia hominis]